jgi:hypothetical protein
MSSSSFINDIRSPQYFKHFSFSNFKKSEVKSQLIYNLIKSKIEPACYWCAELICAGHFYDIWDIFFYFICKHIHIANPKIIIYIQKRFQIFNNIINLQHHFNILQLRNNHNIRILFAEIISILSLSNQKNSFESIKINKIDEFDMTKMTERFKAPSTKYIDDIFYPKDSKELIIPMNELSFNISKDGNNTHMACYWIEWIIEFDALCKKRKKKCFCENRNYNIDHKLKGDIIWVVWDIILHHSNKSNNTFIITTINSLLNLFCINYTTAISKKRKYFFYFAISLLLDSFIIDQQILTNKDVIQKAMNNIDFIYNQIKQNEQTPNTDYLFHNLDEKHSSFEKTIEKIEMINKMDFV